MMMTEMKHVVNHVITPKNIVVVWDYGTPTTIPNVNDKYNEIKELLQQKRFSEVPTAVDKALKIRASSRGKFSVLNGTIIIDGEVLPRALSDKLIDMVDSGADTTRLENFWDNLAQNPTQSAREDLYSFLDANNVPITKDGCFIVYKKVRDDFWDSWTGKTFHCKPGNVIEMDRDKVDPNRNNTCSDGLHVAAWEYAQGFSGRRLVECKVNPRDVVAVPPDYNQQKMRTCRAEILRETNKKYTEHTYNTDVDDGKIVQPTLSVVLSPDKEGRIRIPGKLVRKLGLGVGYNVEVVLEVDGDEHLVVRPESTKSSGAYWAIYTIREDNSIRVSPTVLEWAVLDGADVTVSVDGGELIIE